MGRMIDIDKAREEYRNLIDLTMSDTTLLHTLYGVLDTAPTVEAIPKADYENHLKADLKAILVELQLEIEEIKPLEPTDDEDWQYGCFHGLKLMQDKCLRLIQQKINSLEEA